MRQWITSLVLAIGCSGVAHASSHEPLERSLYVLRSHSSFSTTTKDAEGLWQFDPDTREYHRMHPLGYHDQPGGMSSSLSAFYDRLLVQGPASYEFELPTGRLLRRYNSVAGWQRWSLQGQVVTEEDAATMGIAPGIYGFPICRPSGDLLSCGQIQPPGYDTPTSNVTRFNLVLRRPLDPNNAQLALAADLGSPRDHRVLRRTLTLDHIRDTFWTITDNQLVSDSNTNIERLNQLLLAGPTPEERLVHEAVTTGANTLRRTFGFAHHGPSDAFYQAVHYWAAAYDDFRFLRRGITGSEETIDRNPAMAEITQPVAVTAVPARPPVAYLQTIPVVGKAMGANGTSWRSDLWLFNPADTSVLLTIRRVTTAQRVAYILPAHGSLAIDDVLGALGGGPPAMGGDGTLLDALVLESPYRWGAQVVAHSRTYTDAPAGGSYAQAVPPVPGTTGYSTHLHSYHDPDDTSDDPIALFVMDNRAPDAYRHNLGVVNDSSEEVRVRIRYGTVSPGAVPPDLEREIVVPPHGVVLRSIEQLFPATVRQSRPPRLWIAANRATPVWLSAVDNRTGDATFVPYELFTFRPDASDLTIPHLTSGEGWRADLFGHFPTNPEEAPGLVGTLYTQANDDCRAVSAAPLAGSVGTQGVDTTDPYWHSIYPDVFEQLRPCSAGIAGEISGALALRVASWMAGYVRATRTREDGGTITDLLPFYPLRGWPQQSFPIEHSAGYDVVLRLHNGNAVPAEYEVAVFDATGRSVAQVRRLLSSRENATIPVATLLPGDAPPGMYGVIVRPILGSLGTWASAVVIDKRSGDRTTAW